MVSTGAFALAIFALVYVSFEGTYFFGNQKTNRRDIFKAGLISIPFIVYIFFYLSVFWHQKTCSTEGDLGLIFTIAFAFSGLAIIALFTKYDFAAAHAMVYSSANVAVLAYKSNEHLCGIKPEILVFSIISGVCAFGLFVRLTILRS